MSHCIFTRPPECLPLKTPPCALSVDEGLFLPLGLTYTVHSERRDTGFTVILVWSASPWVYTVGAKLFAIIWLISSSRERGNKVHVSISWHLGKINLKCVVRVSRAPRFIFVTVRVQLSVYCGPLRNDLRSRLCQHGAGMIIPTTLGYNVSVAGRTWKCRVCPWVLLLLVSMLTYTWYLVLYYDIL